MPKCPRCNRGELARSSDSTVEVTYYECPECAWAFAQKPGQSLHDKWLSPISVSLYPQIFQYEPENTGRDAALQLFQTRRDLVAALIDEIRRELKCPTQKVSEIHEFVCKDEVKLRKHLRDLAEGLVALVEEEVFLDRRGRMGVSLPLRASRKSPAE